jgi:aminomethyltransferase
MSKSSQKPLSPGRCIYGAFLTAQGTVVDDGILFQFDKNCYLVVVNAGMGGRIAQHLSVYKGKREVGIIDLTDS